MFSSASGGREPPEDRHDLLLCLSSGGSRPPLAGFSSGQSDFQETAMPSDPHRHSLLTTEGMGRAPNRAMLRAVGFLDDDFERPMVGVASLFSDITPCNAHLD